MSRKIRNRNRRIVQTGALEARRDPQVDEADTVGDEARRLHLRVSPFIREDDRAEFESDLDDCLAQWERLATLRIWQGRIESEFNQLEAALNEAEAALANFGITDPENIKGIPAGGTGVVGLQVTLWLGKWDDARAEIAARVGWIA